jgi:hypothetical protein
LPKLLIGFLLLPRYLRLQLDRSLRSLPLIAAMRVRFLEHLFSLRIVECSLPFSDAELALHHRHSGSGFAFLNVLESFVPHVGGMLGRFGEKIQHARILLLEALLDSLELLDYGSFERHDGALAESRWCQSVELPALLPQLNKGWGVITASGASFVAATLRALGQPVCAFAVA